MAAQAGRTSLPPTVSKQRPNLPSEALSDCLRMHLAAVGSCGRRAGSPRRTGYSSRQPYGEGVDTAVREPRGVQANCDVVRMRAERLDA
jgi:hypothetical protein